MKRTFIHLALLLMIFPHGVVHADSDAGRVGIITGRVEDVTTREPLPGTSVLVIGTERGAVADERGRFRITDVPSGTYSVRASLIGYEAQVSTDILVSPNRPAEVSFELTPTTVELESNVVVRSGFFTKPPDATTSVQSQSSEEIRRLPGGFEDVVRATANLPGVAQVDGGRNDLIVRGGAPTENLYLIDGFRVSNINHFGTQGSSGGPLSYINLDFVENIRFYTGGFGVRYGDRLSSALSINLRDGRTDRFGGKATVSATQFGLNLEGPLGTNGSMLFSARRSYLDFIFKAAGFEFVPEYWDFMAKTTHQISPRDRLSILGIGALDNVRLFINDAEDRYENSRRLNTNMEQAVVGVSWRHLFSRGSVTSSLSQTFVDYDYRQNDSLLNPIFESASQERDLTADIDALVSVQSGLRLSAGLSGQRAESDGNIYLEPFTNTYGETFERDNDFDVDAFKGASYVQLVRDFGAISLTSGLRADYFDAIDNKWAVAPRFAVSADAAGRVTLSGSIGRYYQSPSLIWLGSNPVNRSLDFIRADQAVGGIEILARTDTRISIEGYYKRYRDVPASTEQEWIVLSNAGAGFGGSEESFTAFGIDSLVSEGRGRAYGLELSLQKKLSSSPLYGTVNLSLNRSEYTGLDGVYRDGSYDQTAIVNLTGGYIFNDEWEFSSKFRLATGRPYTPFNPDGTQDPERYNSERLSTSHALDVRVDKRWFFDGWNLTTYLDIQNIYNHIGDSTPRYNAREGIVETEDEIGILPSIGISAEF